MKILVTGSSGFVGKHLTGLLSKDNDVIGFDLKEGFDIRKKEMLERALNGVDFVVHLAALVVGSESWGKPYEYFETNGLGTLNVVLSSIKRKVKRIIVTSSASVYGNPLNPYGASKKWAEAVAETYLNGIETVVIRPFNIYGEGQNPAYGYAIHNFAKGIKELGEVEIYGSGEQSRDFVCIDDVVASIQHLLTVKNLPATPIDLGTGRETTINELAAIEGNLINKKFKIKKLPGRMEPFRSVANLEGLKKAKINPNNFIKLEDGLKKLILR